MSETGRSPGGEEIADDQDDRREPDAGPPRRGFDTILGAASLAAKTTGGVISGGEWVVNVVAGSPVGRLAGRLTRRVTEPLAREGAEVRERLVEVPDAIHEASARVVPAVVETIDPDVLLGAIDLNAIVGRIDLQCGPGTGRSRRVAASDRSQRTVGPARSRRTGGASGSQRRGGEGRSSAVLRIQMASTARGANREVSTTRTTNAARHGREDRGAPR